MTYIPDRLIAKRIALSSFDINTPTLGGTVTADAFVIDPNEYYKYEGILSFEVFGSCSASGDTMTVVLHNDTDNVAFATVTITGNVTQRQIATFNMPTTAKNCSLQATLTSGGILDTGTVHKASIRLPL